MLKQGINFKRFVLTLFLVAAVMLVISACKPKVDFVPVESITISAANNATTITTIGGTLQFSAVILPADADDKSVTWSVQNGTGSATISTSGLLTAVSNGTVTVKAISKSELSVSATKVITISNQDVLASSISVSSENDQAFIDEYHGTLQFNAVVLPANAANKDVIWSVENETGSATISSSGLLTAATNGTVVVKATSAASNAVYGTKIITLTNQDASVSSVEISSANNASEITTFEGTLQFSVTVLPAIAVDKTVVWSVENGTGSASINQSGLLTAASNGTVTVRVTSSSNTTVSDSMIITISNQEVLASSIELTSAGNAVVIDVLGGTLQFNANVLPANTHDKAVVWSVNNGTGEATISETGLLTAVANGTVTVVVISVGNSAVEASMVITISNQEVLVTSISVTGLDNATTIEVAEGTLQMEALVLPENAENKLVVWSVENVTGEATISSGGLLTAVSNGTVIVKATSSSDASVFGTKEITISNQDAEMVLVTSVEVNSAGDAIVIDVLDGTLQMSALVLPEDADDKSVVWSVENVTGEATIDEMGLLTAVANGTVVVKATSVENSEIFGTLEITISNQEILAESIIVTSDGDSAIIDVDKGTLQMYAEVLPVDAEDTMYTWSVENVTGSAMISVDGLLSALTDGTVMVYATLDSDPLIVGSMEITISNQVEESNQEDPVDLLTAGEFTILTKTGISTAADSLVIGNMGVSPVAATYITGFSLSLHSSTTYATSAQVIGMIYAADYSEPTPAYLTQAISDMEAAYTDAASRAPDFTELHAGDLSGQTLVAGVYKYGTDVVVYTDLTLSGSAEDVWIFQISGHYTQAVSVQIILSGGALAENVFWQVAGGVAIETSAHFAGTILSMTEITLGTNATVNGRLLSQTAVTLDANTVGQGEIISVESIVVSSLDDAIIIDTFGGTLQMFAEVLPVDATNKAVVWSVEDGTGSATISEDGLLSALTNGTVTVVATAASDESIFDSMEITLSNQEVLVASISLSGEDDAVIIDTYEGTLQIHALVLPEDAEDKSVVWSVENVTGEATIDEMGLLTAVANGTVVVKATSVENSEIFGTLEITISNQEILAESIIVTSDGDSAIIDVDKGTLQMYAEVLPVDAEDTMYTWSVENVTGSAMISVDGLLSALTDGTVMVYATLDSGPLIVGSMEITISNQVEEVVSGGVDLLSAESFTILAKTGITTTVGTDITGNLGVSPAAAASITGFGLIMDASGDFSTSSLVTGMIYAADYSASTQALLTQAVSDMEAAYTDAASRAPDFTELHAGDISGQTLVPGVYYWSSGLLINTNVTLSGNATDVWIFQIGGTLTQAASVNIILDGGAVAENIVWQVASAVSIGVSAHFEGTILGMTSVNLGTNATYIGKIFAQTAVTLDANDIN